MSFTAKKKVKEV